MELWTVPAGPTIGGLSAFGPGGTGWHPELVWPQGWSTVLGVPKGIRTPVAGLKDRSPRPLDDGDGLLRIIPFPLERIKPFVRSYSTRLLLLCGLQARRPAQSPRLIRPFPGEI